MDEVKDNDSSFEKDNSDSINSNNVNSFDKKPEERVSGHNDSENRNEESINRSFDEERNAPKDISQKHKDMPREDMHREEKTDSFKSDKEFEESYDDDSDDSESKSSMWIASTLILSVLLVASIFTQGFGITGGAVKDSEVLSAGVSQNELIFMDSDSCTTLCDEMEPIAKEIAEKAGLNFKRLKFTQPADIPGFVLINDGELTISGIENEAALTKQVCDVTDNEAVCDEVSVAVQEQAKVAAEAEQPRIDISIDDDEIKGDPGAPVTLIEFSDYECPYCARFASQTLVQIDEKYIKTGKVRLVFRDFPLGTHRNAQKAAEAAECAGEQGKYYEYHDKLFENQKSLSIDNFKAWAGDLDLDIEMFNECLDNSEQADEVKKDLQDGQIAGVSGTPAFFINGKFISGAQPFEVFERIIESELAR
tara:strand:+ start:3769 stop:5034 length:1266 start_codon:yes stop_codon:yes gene_type:complete